MNKIVNTDFEVLKVLKNRIICVGSRALNQFFKMAYSVLLENVLQYKN